MYWNPMAVLGPVTQAFPPALAKTVAVVKTRAPVDSGELRRSIKAVPTGIFSGDIVATAKHAAAVEFGSKPHAIRPIRKRVLYNSKNSFGPVKSAQHPGAAPKPFIHESAAEFRGFYIAEATKRFKF